MSEAYEEFEHQGWRVRIVQDEDAYDLDPLENCERLGQPYYRRLCRDHGYGEPVTDEALFALAEDAAEEGNICFPVASYDTHGPGTFCIDVQDALKPEDELAETHANGIIVVNYQKAAKEFGLEGDALVAKVKEVVEAEAQEYVDWANGNVWGYVIEHPQTGEVEDSCWGFIGDPKYAIEAAKDAISGPAMTKPPTDLEEAIKAFFERNPDGQVTILKDPHGTGIMGKIWGRSTRTSYSIEGLAEALGEDFTPEEIK